jgi:hypothetical protein
MLSCPALQQPQRARETHPSPLDAPCRPEPETWRPIAFVSLQAIGLREQIRAVLDSAGWAVVDHPSGFHVVRAVADLIEDRAVWRRPGLIVIDAWSRGCAGVSLATGLHELGVAIPVVVVAPGPAPDGAAASIVSSRAYVVDADKAPQVVATLARRLFTDARRHTVATSTLDGFESALIAYPHGHFHVHSHTHSRKEDTL